MAIVTDQVRPLKAGCLEPGGWFSKWERRGKISNLKTNFYSTRSPTFYARRNWLHERDALEANSPSQGCTPLPKNLMEYDQSTDHGNDQGSALWPVMTSRHQTACLLLRDPFISLFSIWMTLLRSLAYVLWHASLPRECFCPITFYQYFFCLDLSCCSRVSGTDSTISYFSSFLSYQLSLIKSNHQTPPAYQVS